LIKVLRQELEGEVVELSVHRDRVSPCLDCRYCLTRAQCAIHDDMDVVYADDYDNLVIASPVYYGQLTGPMVSLASRLQIYREVKHDPPPWFVQRPKRGAAILTGGGKANWESALRFASVIFRILNAKRDERDLALSFNTDTVPAADDLKAHSQVRAIAARLNQAR
jgi:multimeric flavodoxin WrbA